MTWGKATMKWNINLGTLISVLLFLFASVVISENELFGIACFCVSSFVFVCSWY